MTEENDDFRREPAATPQADSPEGNRVELSTPWGRSQAALFDRPGSADSFVEQRSRVHEIYIREQARNKRIGLVLAFLLILSAATLVMFAPEGRQNLSYWLGLALLVFAAGASGFGRIWGKTKTLSFGADQDKRSLSE